MFYHKCKKSLPHICEKKFPQIQKKVYPTCKTPLMSSLESRFVTSLGYYGLSLGVDLLHGSLFVNSCLSGAVELPAYVIAIFSLTKIGRRWPTIISFILVALFCFLCVPFFQKTGRFRVYDIKVVFCQNGYFPI